MTVHPRTWTTRHTLMLLAMLCLCIWTFRAPLTNALAIGVHDQDQSHILLAPLVALWLAWLRRSRLQFIKVQPNYFGPALVAAGVVASWVGFRMDIHTAWYVGPLLAMVGMVVSIAGTRPLRLFAPVFLTLIFFLPVPGAIRQSVSLPLQSMAASVTHGSLEVFGVQASRLGNVISVNGEQIALAEACSGLRLVFSLTLVVFAFAFSTPLRPGTRALIILLSPLLAILANVVRLVPTSLLYGRLSIEHAALFHDLTGWLMLPIALIALIAALRVLRWLELPVTTYRLAGS